MATMAEVMDKLEHALDDFGFETDGLGQRMVNTLATTISERGLARAEGPHGSFRANTEFTIEQKTEWFGTAPPPNTATGHMLSIDSVRGQPEISQTKVKWVYGNNSMTASPPGGYHSRTDKQKAEYAHGTRDGGAHDRPFFELNEEDTGVVQGMTAATLGDHLRSRLT